MLALAGVAASTHALAQAATPVPEPPAQLAPSTKPAAPPVVEVRHYLVLGVTLLDAAMVRAALTGLIGQRTVEELHGATGQVQALYARAGYGAVVVYLPPQEVSGGVITLQVIEGRLSAVRVDGAGPAFGEAGILASLPALQAGQTPRLDRIDAQLRMANDNPAKRTRLVLLPGQQPEQTEAEIAVEPAPRRQLGLELDDSGTPATGRAHLGLTWRDANASGRDDVLELRLQVAPEQPRQFAAAGLSYRLPLYRARTMLDAFALLSDTRSASIPTALGELRFAGRGHLLGLRATHYLPRLAGVDARLALALEYRDQRNQCAIGTLPTGACGSAGGDLTILPLTLEYSLAGDAHRPLAMSVAWVQGLPAGGGRADRAAFDAVRPGARPTFTALRAQWSAQQRLSATGWVASARVAGQWAAQPLVPAMQFGAGGRSSVRGYEERELAADHGLALSFELSAPGWQGQPWPSATLRPLLFVDAATLRNRDAAPCSGMQLHCDLASAGVGLRFDARALTASLDLAHALRSAGTTQRGHTRGHVWLRLVY